MFKNIRQTIQTILFIVLIWVIFAAFTGKFSRFIESIKSTSWSQADGIVLGVHVVIHDEGPEVKSSRRWWHELQVTYNYQIGNQLYFTDRIMFRPMPTDGNDTKGFYAGQKIKVYYNPTNPEQAVLVPGVDWFSLL